MFPPFRPDMDMVLSFRRKRCGSFSERKKRETGQRGSTFPLALLDVQPTVDYEPSPKEAPPSVRGIWPWPRLVGQDLQLPHLTQGTPRVRDDGTAWGVAFGRLDLQFVFACCQSLRNRLLKVYWGVLQFGLSDVSCLMCVCVCACVKCYDVSCLVFFPSLLKAFADTSQLDPAHLR